MAILAVAAGACRRRATAATTVAVGAVPEVPSLAVTRAVEGAVAVRST